MDHTWWHLSASQEPKTNT